MNAKPFRLAAALAYYTLFSLAPLLVVALGIAGLAFGEEAARGQIFGPLQSLLGPKSADAVQNAVAAASIKSSGVFATITGLSTLLLGASAVFGELQDALNTIWDAKPPPNAGIWDVAKKRLISMSMVLVIGFLLLVSLALSAMLNAVGAYMSGILPVSALSSRRSILSYRSGLSPYCLPQSTKFYRTSTIAGATSGSAQPPRLRSSRSASR
jgi:membrane protein